MKPCVAGARVTAGEVLRLAAGAGRTNQFNLTNHARDQMEARGVTVRELRIALQSATGADHDPEKDTWRLTGGCDADGEPLTIAIAVGGPIRIVTVFER